MGVVFVETKQWEETLSTRQHPTKVSYFIVVKITFIIIITDLKWKQKGDFDIDNHTEF